MVREPRAVRVGRDVHVNVLLLANRSLDALEEICQADGITHQQYVALWTLCLADDPDAGLPVGAVADGLLNRASDTTRLIDRLEKAGLAERLPNPNDRRSVLVRATAAGRRVFAAVTPKLQEFHRRQWSALSTRRGGHPARPVGEGAVGGRRVIPTYDVDLYAPDGRWPSPTSTTGTCATSARWSGSAPTTCTSSHVTPRCGRSSATRPRSARGRASG